MLFFFHTEPGMRLISASKAVKRIVDFRRMNEHEKAIDIMYAFRFVFRTGWL